MATGSQIRPLRWLLGRWRNASPSTIFVASFAALIVVGTGGLLVLPGLYTGRSLGLLDALFTITSAVCVTGLVVVDTATFFTFWGQLWILLFIQLGGLGLITLTTLIIGVLGRRISLRSEMIAAPPVDVTHRHDAPALIFAAIKFTAAIEAAGAFLLWLQWFPRFGMVEGAWHAVFHAVSAFCNAGFSTFTTSMMPFQTDAGILAVVGTLVVVGGFGYLSSEEALRWWRDRGQERRRRVSTHTWAAAVTTLALLGAGFLLFAVFEWNGVLRGLGFLDKLSNALFMSVVPRTAGYNSVSYAEVGNGTAFLTILLMVVGGAPGSTAGGIKVTALAVLAALAISRIRGRRHVDLHGRTLPEGTIQRTVSLALLAFAIVTAAVFVLIATETVGLRPEDARAKFLPLFFEVVSAFGTVGLSMDVTPTLSAGGKLASIVLMFVGRVGPLPFFAALALRGRAEVREIRSAREDLIVG